MMVKNGVSLLWGPTQMKDDEDGDAMHDDACIFT
jgi:hypothetical protein